jgi:NurA domain
MLYRNLLVTALNDRREDFVRFDRAWRDEVREYARRLRLLGGQTSQEVRRATGTTARAPGALPSTELESVGSMAVSFGQRWRSHEEARRWAVDVLQERVTFAADGSQLLPGREISMPVAAVQVAWFENPHTREGSYRKEARFSIISPAELLEESDERISPETIVGFRRFQLEAEILSEFLEKKRGWRDRGERTPVAFFDGTLFPISSALPRTKIQSGYVDAIVELVRLSRETEVPVIGYIDQSYARDLVWLLRTLGPPENGSTAYSLYDAQLLRASVESEPPMLEYWGDRTSFCYCMREGLSKSFIDERGEPLVGFTYLQTTGDGLPARLDVPAWIYEAGLLDTVVDAVRAECVGGLGYPYAIETADAAAVITARDREQFLRLIQDFAKKESFAFRVSRKAASKVRRR